MLVFQASLRKAISPPKVRNKVTSLPIAAAPAIIVVAAMILSTVPENSTMENFSLISTSLSANGIACVFVESPRRSAPACGPAHRSGRRVQVAERGDAAQPAHQGSPFAAHLRK